MVLPRDQIGLGVVEEDEEVISLIRSEASRRRGVRLLGPATDPDRLLAEPHPPELLVVDPRVPGREPRSLLERLTVDFWPRIVLVTSETELAVSAFERGVVDFLVKPAGRERISQALDRALSRVRARQKEVRLRRFLRTVNGRPRPERATVARAHASPRFPGRLLLRETGRAFFVDTEDIEYIQSDGNYLRVHEGPRHHLVRGTMEEALGRLDPRRFVRIHRSTIVNIDHVRELVPDLKGRYVVRLGSGAELILSRGYRDEVLARAL